MTEKERIVLYFLGWIIILVIILAFIPGYKIKEIGGFFEKILAKLSISDIIRMFIK
jgi:hypothetical protein